MFSETIRRYANSQKITVEPEHRPDIHSHVCNQGGRVEGTQGRAQGGWGARFLPDVSVTQCDTACDIAVAGQGCRNLVCTVAG